MNILEKKISIKSALIIIGVTFVTLVICVVLYILINYELTKHRDREEFSAAQARCQSSQVVVGWKDLYGGKMYYPLGNSMNTPTTDASYFCSNEDAEKAGYRQFP